VEEGSLPLFSYFLNQKGEKKDSEEKNMSLTYMVQRKHFDQTFSQSLMVQVHGGAEASAEEGRYKIPKQIGGERRRKMKKNTKNCVRKPIIAILFAAIMIVSVLAIVPTVSANDADFFIYSELNTGVSGSYGVDGYVGVDGVNRIIFYSGSTAYIYTVTIPAGTDPNTHPNNPEAPGEIAPRTFTLEKTFDLGVFCEHECEFYVDEEDNIIYLGATVGIRKYIYDDPLGNYVYDSLVAPPAPTQEGYGTQSLAYNPDTDTWYAGSIAWNYNPGVTLRDMWKYDGSQGPTGTWELAFQYTTPEGIDSMTHHDGLEFITGYLWLADYVGDYIKQYTRDGTLEDVFWHEPLAHELEGMGFGALMHFWCGSHGSIITEFGGGPLQAAVEGIPDQCIFTDEAFDTFDLDDYTVGAPSFTWTCSGNVNLVVSIDAENVVTIAYPAGWTGSETITFTVTDSLGYSASDKATFEVHPVPVVGDIPDQVMPFTPFDLDDYLSGIAPALVTWSVSDPGDGWTVDINSENVVTVTAPEGATEPVTITFTATTTACGREASDSDDATFIPNRPPDVTEAYPCEDCLWPPNQKFVDITIEGVTDPDGDEVTITINKITSDEPTAEIEGAGGDKHAPDAEGVGTDTASLRAERSGTGNGRVYEITFVASDGIAERVGSVFVKVPHDQSDDCESIDDGQIYDATAIN
jgi:hypothetical protein